VIASFAASRLSYPRSIDAFVRSNSGAVKPCCTTRSTSVSSAASDASAWFSFAPTLSETTGASRTSVPLSDPAPRKGASGLRAISASRWPSIAWNSRSVSDSR
jgi:hypothetical protein